MRPVLALALVLSIVAACGSDTPTTVPDGSSTPIATGGSTSDGRSTPPASPVPVPKHEVYGFVPYWEMDDGIAAHVRDVDLSTLALFSVTHKRSGDLATNQNGYKRIVGPIGRRLIRDAHARKRRVELVYTSFGTDKNRRFFGDQAAQERWIGQLVDLADELGVDGINVDVEQLPVELIPAYGSFVGRLRAALLERLPDAGLSAATGANERGAAMAAAAADAGADRIFLMGYDYHWAGSDPGASAPLDRYDGEVKDLVWSLDTYAALGVPVERTLLGLPLYGMTWPVVGPGVGSPATGRGDHWVPRKNLRVFQDPSFAPLYEPIESVEFYSVPAAGPAPSGELVPGGSADAEADRGWDAVYYDSPRSLTPKLALADDRGLAGVGFWAIGYERGLPGYGELIATFRAGKLDGSSSSTP